MHITVKYFASLRERVGRGSEQLEIDGELTVAGLWQQVLSGKLKGEPISDDDAILAAVNHDYVERDHPLKDGDEVAFFPPVTGG
jgi:sulfur-carrier protein